MLRNLIIKEKFLKALDAKGKSFFQHSGPSKSRKQIKQEVESTLEKLHSQEGQLLISYDQLAEIEGLDSDLGIKDKKLCRIVFQVLGNAAFYENDPIEALEWRYKQMEWTRFELAEKLSTALDIIYKLKPSMDEEERKQLIEQCGFDEWVIDEMGTEFLDSE